MCIRKQLKRFSFCSFGSLRSRFQVERKVRKCFDSKKTLDDNENTRSQFKEVMSVTSSIRIPTAPQTFGAVQSSFCCCKKRSIFLFSCVQLLDCLITDIRIRKSTQTKANLKTSTSQLSFMPKIRCLGGSILIVALFSLFQKTSLRFFNSESRQFSNFLNK